MILHASIFSEAGILFARCATLALQSSTVPHVSLLSKCVHTIDFPFAPPLPVRGDAASLGGLPVGELWPACPRRCASTEASAPRKKAAWTTAPGPSTKGSNWKWNKRRRAEQPAEQPRQQPSAGVPPSTQRVPTTTFAQNTAFGGQFRGGGRRLEQVESEQEAELRRDSAKKRLREFLERARRDLEAAENQARKGTAPAGSAKPAGAGAGGALPPGVTAAQALRLLLPQHPADQLRPLAPHRPASPQPPPASSPPSTTTTNNNNHKPAAAAAGTAAANSNNSNSNSSSSGHRLDPQEAMNALRVFGLAADRLGFRTQVPAAFAEYLPAAAAKGLVDLAAQPAGECVRQLEEVAKAEVVNRRFLDAQRKGLQSRWGQLRPEELLAALSALRRLNDADRAAAPSGRPGAASSRLLRLLLDAEPSVTALLNGNGAAADAAGGPDAGAVSLPAGAPVALARAYLSFYLTASSGHQYFGMAPMLLRTLRTCVEQLDPTDPRVTPADELARLVAGLAAVVALPGHELAEPLRRCAAAVSERAGELSQPALGLLVDLPAQHFALPPEWRQRLQAAAAERAGDGRGVGRVARCAQEFLAARKAASTR